MTDVWPPWSSAEALNAWSALATSAIAGAAAVVAYGQIRQTRASGDNAEAQEAYRRYLELAIEHPRFASPSYLTLKQDAQTREQYNWYVSYLLGASEKIIGTAGQFEEWYHTIKLNISYHDEILRDIRQFEDSQLACYDERLRKIIAEVSGRLIPQDREKSWASRLTKAVK